ncbi:hypothetical protein [Maridesulfovibrio sp.]|uniref:hypothetical protein n=1 Tax=Maridesulfovibrio sp. TaxID=2795000 RepID=UPI002A18CBAB|nr:hypothetical protein [Maridesulfovibrio sp.]
MSKSKDVEILECTLRDGSYAIDFKFTSSDTALLTKQISKAGFNWIEIGHGLGIGAAESGKGKMPHNDLQLLRAAKESTDAKIGMFYIPTISSRDNLKEAVDNGLDFVRIGANATEASEAFPEIEYAKSLGLTAGMNFMKSYSVSADEFGNLGKGAVEHGADMVYLVDSVGGMNPQEVESYLNAVRKKCDCDLGYHGHDNLKMAVANTLKAYECGARFLDATIMGIGRGAGNAASEALVCLLEDLGVKTGIDIGLLLNIADTYVWPLIRNLSMYDTKEVAMGFGKMHSSHMPKIRAASQKYRVDEKELIMRMGRIDPVHIDDKTLEDVSKELRDTVNNEESLELISYPGLDDNQDSIELSPDNLDEFIKGVSVTVAKRTAAIPVIEIIYTGNEQQDFISAECLWSSDRIVFSRLFAGNYQLLMETVEKFKDVNFKFLIDPKKLDLDEQTLLQLINALGIERTYTIDSKRLKAAFASNLLSHLGIYSKNKSLLIFGDDKELSEHILSYSSFDQIFIVDPEMQKREGAIFIRDINDWTQLNIKVDLIYLAYSPNIQTMEKLTKIISEEGFILTPHKQYSLSGSKLKPLNLNAAYEGVIHQIQFLESTF